MIIGEVFNARSLSQQVILVLNIVLLPLLLQLMMMMSSCQLSEAIDQPTISDGEPTVAPILEERQTNIMNNSINELPTPPQEATISSTITITEPPTTSTAAAATQVITTNETIHTTTTQVPITTAEVTQANETTTTTSSSTKRPIECLDTKYCFNGGKCILNDLGHPQCICIEGFYGNRCQTKDICKSVIVDSLTGYQICAQLDRGCFKNDKFFRCSCLEDEYFIFKILNQDSSTTNNNTNNNSNSHREQTDDRSATKLKRKLNLEQQQQQQQLNGKSVSNLKRSKSERLFDLLNQQQHPDSATFAYDIDELKQSSGETSQTLGANLLELGTTGTTSTTKKSYLAECRKIDLCLGIRCRQLSEVCLNGKCICNQDAGYISDPTDGNMCKLLDPCSMPSNTNNESKAPICGQAKCVATYNRESFRCVCPIGHSLIQIGDRKSSSVCAPLDDAICNVPLLNKCQHLCHIDLVQNTYKCSCFRGYNAGKLIGIDDHMCFFDEHTNEDPDLFGAQGRASSDEQEINRPNEVFRWYKIPQFIDPKFTPSNGSTSSLSSSSPSQSSGGGPQKFTYDSELKPVPVNETIGVGDDAHEEEENDDDARTGHLFVSESDLKSLRPDQYLIKRVPTKALREGGRQSWATEWDESVAKMSAQERCNKMCGENRICVLEKGSNDSYRCICTRQGYVSVEDRCLNWCAAAEFSLRIRVLLYKYGCWTQVCKQVDIHPQFWDLSPPPPLDNKDSLLPGDKQVLQGDSLKEQQQEKARREEERKFMRLSSWRPRFECDCSSSPFLKQNPETKLCQLDFRATLEPCLPGNAGYIDCVENKNAYCAVLHRSSWSFIKDLIHDKYKDNTRGGSGKGDESSSSSSSSSSSNSKSKSKQAKLANEKLYTCVCSPDKKFLVDKPRNKERCVDECNMLNIECVRFNRMCRSASIAPDDFGKNNLVRYDLDGAVKMNFRRTGCECLPGFNVGPSESLDFTLDDEDDQMNKKQEQTTDMSSSTPSPKDPDGYPMPDIVDSDDILEQAEHMRAKYINIDSSCLLDYDVVEFHASFKSPADFDPSWVKMKNPLPELPASKKKANRKNSRKERKNGHNNNSNTTTSDIDNNNNINSGGNDNSNHERDPRTHYQSSNETGFFCDPMHGCQLEVPRFMQYNISDLHKNIVLVAQCEPAIVMHSLEAYQECIRYRYWIIQKLRRHYVDWRLVITRHLSDTFDLMDGNIRLRVNRCESTLKNVFVTDRKANNIGNSSSSSASSQSDREQNISSTSPSVRLKMIQSAYLDPMDPESIIDADIDCELTLHSASDGSSPRYSRKVLLEKQLQKFIFVEPTKSLATIASKQFAGENYYLMAPNMLIRRESFDQLAEHRKLFNPCESDYAYCDLQTDCHMVDTVNFTCTCKFGYTPIGSRDIYYGDSRKEVCEDIDECLFDVCKDLAGVADCENTIGDYKCLCRNQYTGDNKRYCNHVCNTINCHHLHGKCRIVAPHHALCECEDGYKEADCSVQDPNVALRKANMIIVGSIFTSVLLLMITLAISLNSQLKKTKKKLKRLEAVSATAHLFELHTPQPFRPRMSKAS